MQVKIGDTIEFAVLNDASDHAAATAAAATLTTTARVTDVNPNDPMCCTVQTSPYEPLRSIDLRQCAYKIVYAVGDVALLTHNMVGWRIEVANDVQEVETAVIKRIDSDINCALVAFESGRKEWLDLSLSAFKIVAQPSLPLLSGDQDAAEQREQQSGERVDEAEMQQQQQHEQLFAATSKLDPGDSSAAIVIAQFPTKELPKSDVTSFDWYAEGGHVEICDARGGFLEGAVLCSKTDTHVHLYSEARQFFEFAMVKQAFKVVIHGLLSLKWIPIGQTVEVYSAMTGGFVFGTVIKAAEVGKLTPIRFARGAVEWLDLSTQTFKLVFLTDSDAADHESVTIAEHSPSIERSPASSPSHKHHHGKRHPHRQYHASVPELPVLKVGQRIEIFEAASKQFAKYKVAAVIDTHRSPTYDMELETRASHGASAAADAASTPVSTVTVPNLANVRCRIPLLPHMWSEYGSVLLGHRVDIYDKVEKTVAGAKIVQVGDSPLENGSEPGLLVRYKDGTRGWIHSQHVKLKLRLNGEPLEVLHSSDHREAAADTIDSTSSGGFNPTDTATRLAQARQSAHENGDVASTSEMWERLPQPESPRANALHSQDAPAQAKARLSRHYSDAASISNTVAAQHPPPTLGLCASTNDLLAQRSITIDSMRMTQQIPAVVQPLDFSTLRKIQTTAAAMDISDPALVETSEGISVNASESARSSSRSRKSSDSAPTSSRGVPFSMDDVWREERDHERGIVEYVCIASGQRQSHVPEWLERSDASTGKLFVVHIPTSTLYSMPTNGLTARIASDRDRAFSNRANSSASGSASVSPGDSGGRVVVPVGPLEAVRVYNMLDK